MSSKRGRKCSIKTCDNFQHTHKHLSFFRFPKDMERCRAWIEKTKRFDLVDKTNVHDERICQQHFEPLMFLNESRNRLQQYALPTLYLTTKPPPPPPSAQPAKPLPMNDLLINGLPIGDKLFNNALVDTAAALLYQNNLTITPVYSSTPKAKKNQTFPEPINLSTSCQNGFHSMNNSAIINLSDSSRGSSNSSIQLVTSSTSPSTNGTKAVSSPSANTNMNINSNLNITNINQNLNTNTNANTSIAPTVSSNMNTNMNTNVNTNMNTNINTNVNINMNASISTSVTTNSNANPSTMTNIANAGGFRRPRQVFSMEQENQLADYVRETSNYYSGLSSKEVRIMAFVYGVCNQVEMPTGWHETHQASFDWCVGFIKRTKLPPTMITGISTKGSSKQTKSSTPLDTKSIKLPQSQSNGNSVKNNENCTPIEID